MRLTKKNPYLKIENLIKNNNNKISRDLDKNKYSYQVNSQTGGVFLQKLLKTNEGYKSINNEIKMDSHNLINLDTKIQNNISFDDNKKSISYIINSLNDKNREIFKRLKIQRNNYNSYNYKNFSTEQDVINDSKNDNLYIDMNRNESKFNGHYQKNNSNEINEIENHKNENKNVHYIRENIFNNKSKKLNLNYSKNNMNINLTEIDFLNQSERNNYYNEDNNNIQSSEKISKKYTKQKNNNKNQDYFRNLKLINNGQKKIIINDNQIDNTKIIKSPKVSTSKREFSPFNDILSKSSNNFFINKIPINNNENDSLNNYTVKHFKNKNSISKNSKKCLITINNNYINNSNIIHRNKKSINKKIFQTNSFKNNTSRNKYESKNSIFLNSHIFNDKNENDVKINKNYTLNENDEENNEKRKNININNDELKKYIQYFIKDITPININQFVIYSHSNNNYKSENFLNNKENNIFPNNKNFISINKSQEFKSNYKNSKQNMNNSIYMEEFKQYKLKEKYLDFNNDKIKKIHVKKRPINENINPNNNIIIKNYTGFSLCQQNKGETILNIPINLDNLYTINQFLKDSGFQIIKIKNKNKQNSKEKVIQKEKKDISNQKEDLNKKNNKINNEIKELPNKKEKTKGLISEAKKENIDKNTNQTTYKKSQTKSDENCKQNTIKNKNYGEETEIQKKIYVKLNGNFEEFENNYLNKNKEKLNLDKIAEEEFSKNKKVSTPNFKF